MIDSIKLDNYSDINIIYEDNHLLVVDKPEGILSQEDITKDLDILTVLKKYLKEKYNKKGDAYLGLVHRLDRRVSGVMVFGKTSKASSRLSECIRNKEFKKIYIAICSGYLEGKGKLINKIDKKDGLAVQDESGKDAVLEYEVIGHFKLENDFSVVKINLLTGKYNQIRKQMELIGHPLINDFKYGYRGKNYHDSLGLRCVEIGFNHPTTKEFMTFKGQVIDDKTSWKKYFNLEYGD